MNLKRDDSATKLDSWTSVVRNAVLWLNALSTVQQTCVAVGYEANRPSDITSPCVFSSKATRQNCEL